MRAVFLCTVPLSQGKFLSLTVLDPDVIGEHVWNMGRMQDDVGTKGFCFDLVSTVPGFFS
jgi:hypothetical protein